MSRMPKSVTSRTSPALRMRPVPPLRSRLRRCLIASPMVPIRPASNSRKRGRSRAPSSCPPSSGSLTDRELFHERPVATLVLVERHGRGRRVAVLVEAVGAGGELEGLRVLDRLDDLLAGRHLAARRVDRATDRVEEDLRAVVAWERVRPEVFLLREPLLEVRDELVVRLVLRGLGGGIGEVHVRGGVVACVLDALRVADAIRAEVRD